MDIEPLSRLPLYGSRSEPAVPKAKEKAQSAKRSEVAMPITKQRYVLDMQ